MSCAPGQREIGCRRAGLPDVLADRRRHEHVAESQEQEIATRGEVPVLVEDAVVGKEVLAVHGGHAAVCAHGARVREVAIEDGAPDECRDPLARRRHLVERSPRCL